MAKVHSYIVCLISENSVAKQKILPHKGVVNGRVYYLAIKELYKWVGTNAKAVLAAESDLQDLFYECEKKPHMWWDIFGIHLNNTFAVLDKNTGRQFHTDEMKLCLLKKKVGTYFLTFMKTNLYIHMNIVPMNITY